MPSVTPLPATAFPDGGRAALSAILQRHGLHVRLEAVHELPRIGTVNTALALGEDYVLRIPKAHGFRETLTESVAAPAALAAGLLTPALIAFDDTRDILDAPYTIYEPVRGVNFGALEIDDPAYDDVYRQLGRQLARLHAGVDDCPDPKNYLDTPVRRDPAADLRQLHDTGLLSPYTIRWLERRFDRLRPAIDGAAGYRRFLHNDALPTNVMVDPSRAFAALIDWNNAGWGDPALEFWAVPSRAVPLVLSGYRDVTSMDGEDTVEHRILWDHLCHALSMLLTPPREANICWARAPASRLAELLAAAVGIDAWRQILR